MNKNDNLFNSHEVASLMSAIHGLIILISILSTFIFWFCLSVLVLIFLNLKDTIGYLQALGIFGLSPVALTVFSWRIVLKIISSYLQKYTDEHTKSKEDS